MGVLHAALWVVTSLIALMIVGEVAIDLPSTRLVVLIPFGLAMLVLSIMGRSARLQNVATGGFILTSYLMVEIHFLVNPRILHVVHYWMAFVVIIALLLRGPRSMLWWTIVVLVTIAANTIYVGEVIGDSYNIEVNRIPFLFLTVLFNLATLSAVVLLYNLLGKAYYESSRKSAELLELKLELEQKATTLSRYQASLLGIARHEHVTPSKQDRLFQTVCRAAAENIGVDRVSVWKISENHDSIVRQYLIEKGVESTDPLTLTRQQYPVYFDALRTTSHILAEDARTHPVTSEFTESYLTPLNIHSMLDCPIMLETDLYGVICCEHTGTVRKWNAEDSIFVQSLADLIAISFKNEKIRALLVRIRSQNHELVGKTNEIEAINEQLNALNEELTTMNESLEATVRRRTEELETQNQQLTEYAFINSHLLRAPLARILGLANLISSEVTTYQDQRLMQGLIQSTHELDTIIRRISDVLYAGSDLTRSDVNELISKNLRM